MQIPYWAVPLLGASLIAAGWLLYRSLSHKGRTLLRLQALERQLAARNSTEELLPLRPRLFHSFAVNSQFDVDHILSKVVYDDEYGITQQHLDPGDVIVDVGAHIGSFSFLCHLLGSRAIFSYEPGERNFQLLKHNVGSLPGVHLFQAAVWRSDGDGQQELILSEASENSGAHSVLAPGHILSFNDQQVVDPSRPGYRVSSVPLDAILERFNRIKLLKIDCEGSEFPILLTSGQLNRVERVVGEIHELEESIMKVLDGHSRVPGYAAYRVENLVARLESVGFQVTLRRRDAHMYLFDARRREPGNGAQAGQEISSTGLRS